MENKIITNLINGATPFQEIKQFSDQPGIYAFFFYGQEFPIPDYQPKKGEIIYIGKTESSQKSRDADTHFKSGKTGSSTVRRTFGSLLRSELGLKPVPRSQSDIEKGRSYHFKFDEPSEEKLTKWMKSNLGLSFYEYEGNISKLEKLEEALIKTVIPVLNLDKNPDNPYAHIIKQLRKATGDQAYSGNRISIAPHKEFMQQKVNPNRINPANIHKYEDIWKMVLPDIKSSLEGGSSLEIQLKKSYFDAVGNRKSYAFNLEFNNGRIANNIGGSAVARDLARVILHDPQVKKALVGKYIKIRMDKYFLLHIN